MAFNPFTSFQRNRKFWMASILMICMVTFVFCTGIRGDMQDRLLRLMHPRGPAIAVVGGHNVSLSELYELKTQRNIADEMMKRCADLAFKRISKIIFEESKKDAGKDGQKRREALAQFEAVRMSLAYRKNRPRYFESGVKFDDLLEFKLWQAEADRLGIRLEEGHVLTLFLEEFFSATPNVDYRYLQPSDIERVEFDLRRSPMGTPALIRRAIGEEFRVRIAQFAVMGAQPFSFLHRQRRQDEAFLPKFTFPDIPDEIRAPMTPAQLWDFYKTKRSEFDVTLIPVNVEDFAKEVRTPTEIDKKAFFEQHKGKAYDPSSGEFGLEIPSKIKVELVTADPNSAGYLNLAEAKELLEVASPVAWNPMQSPLTTAVRFAAAAQAEKMVLQRQYEAIVRDRLLNEYMTTSFIEGDVTTPIHAFLARRHPQAAVSLVGNALLEPADRGMSALAGYLAWGATKEHEAEVQSGVRAELERRSPRYAELFAASTSARPFELLASIVALGEPSMQTLPVLPVEVVARDLREMVARRKAEEWARDNMQAVRQELDNARGDRDKFKRVLNKMVPEFKLTHLPPPAERGNYYDRYTISEAKEFEPLKEAYLKYMDRINFFEGRDLNPETLLKPNDFYKMFFDAAEHFSATSLYRAMPWPPAVTPNSVRMWKQQPDRRMFDLKNLDNDARKDFLQHMEQNDPNRPPPAFDMFATAEKPILFWRTDEVSPLRLSDYDKVGRDLARIGETIKSTEKKLAQAQNASDKARLEKDLVKVKVEEGEYKEIENRITKGFQFELARTSVVLPKAQEIASNLIKVGHDPEVMRRVAKNLKEDLIVLRGVSAWHPDSVASEFGNAFDYFDYPLPKDKIKSPRPDMSKHVSELYDLKKPMEVNLPELDKINKQLFDMVKDEKSPQGHYVQVLTNKARSVFYVAVVTSQPRAEFMPFAKLTLVGAGHGQQFFRDQFVARAQQEEAKLMRRGYVQDLERVLGFEVKDTDARKNFDEKGGD